MALRVADEEVWYWYQTIEKYHESELTPGKFCKKFNIDYKTFRNRYLRIAYTGHTNPDQYAEWLDWFNKYQSSSLYISKFAKLHGIALASLSAMQTHRHYVDAIERLKIEKGILPAKMNFIQVPVTKPKPLDFKAPSIKNIGGHIQKPEEAEVIEKQNDIEIIISKGVKVSISPNIDSMKIIKIIELLKDL